MSGKRQTLLGLLGLWLCLEASALAQKSELARTSRGTPISVYRLQNLPVQNKATAYFYIQGGLHGNELMASEFVLWMKDRFEKGASLLNQLNGGKVNIDFVPHANPDGTLFYSRFNARGVNLNRNFPVLWGQSRENPGSRPLSEVETSTVAQLFKKRTYTAAVDVHGYIPWLVAPSAPKDMTISTNTQKEFYAAWYGTLSNSLANLPAYELKTGAELGDGGAFEDWAFWQQGVFAYCLEIKSQQRFWMSFAEQVFDAIKSMRSLSAKGREDSFLIYEKHIYDMFAAATRLKNSKPTSVTIITQK